jgi:hypothetical protein
MEVNCVDIRIHDYDANESSQLISSAQVGCVLPLTKPLLLLANIQKHKKVNNRSESGAMP